ncbi:hypothetical protein BQ6471_02133 [Vibrio gazogenes]|nr:hypothetical protein BQ6471_02133 [Vibrio gazogenes]
MKNLVADGAGFVSSVVVRDIIRDTTMMLLMLIN